MIQKENKKFRKMFIVTEYAALTNVPFVMRFRELHLAHAYYITTM